MGAASSSLIMPRNRRSTDLPLDGGEKVSTIDGELIGRVGIVDTADFQVIAPGGDFWLSRDDIFLADSQGIALAYGLEELNEHKLYHIGEVA